MDSTYFESIQQFLRFFTQNPHIQAVVVIALSFLLARIASWLISGVLTRLTRHTKSALDDQILRLLGQPVRVSVLMTGTAIALMLIDPPERMAYAGYGIIKTLVILVWTIFVLRAALLLMGWMTQHPDRFKVVQPATLPLFEMTAKVIAWVAAVYFLLISWQLNPLGLLASAGVIGLAVGFAAKDTLANLFAGVFILADAPYKIGDFIVLDNGERGRVTKIGLRSTRILTRNDVEITIPNSAMGNSKITNESGGPWIKQRLQIRIGVAYGSDVDRVKEVLLQTTRENPMICEEPPAWIQFNSFGDSSLNFEIRCWIEDPALRGRTFDAINTAAYKALGQAGIEIPFPKRDIYIKELPKS